MSGAVPGDVDFSAAANGSARPSPFLHLAGQSPDTRSYVQMMNFLDLRISWEDENRTLGIIGVQVLVRRRAILLSVEPPLSRQHGLDIQSRSLPCNTRRYMHQLFEIRILL